jgi:hypothetical protein
VPESAELLNWWRWENAERMIVLTEHAGRSQLFPWLADLFDAEDDLPFVRWPAGRPVAGLRVERVEGDELTLGWQ